MSRRKKDKTRSDYLDPVYEDVQNALKRTHYGKRKDRGMSNVGQFGGFAGNDDTWKNSYSTCKHTGDKIVYEFDNKKIYASSWNGLNEYSDKWDLVIDLAGNVKPKTVYVLPSFVKGISNERFEDLSQYAMEEVDPPKEMSAELLSLDWPDMSAPRASLDFWVHLWDRLPAKTVIACVGGHGRTGTAIASLMIVTGIDYYTALETVRKEHCKKAVETMSQEQYLHKLYMARLKAWIKLAAQTPGTEADIKDYEEDLKYAEKNPPKQGDLRGYSLLHGGSTALTAPANPDYNVTPGYPHGNNIPGTRFRSWPITESEVKMTKITIHNVPYIKQCIAPSTECSDETCTKPEHMGWMPDFIQLSADNKLTQKEEEAIFGGTDNKLFADMWGV